MSNDSRIPLGHLLAPYNPWWVAPTGAWRQDLPSFERPILAELEQDVASLPQMVSVTGPRRVGKTTLLRQLVVHLLDRCRVAPEHILYFSLDDPAVFTSPELQDTILERLIEHRHVQPEAREPVHYFLLDEIQRLPRWELFLKKYYDLHYPIRFVVSGSASSPIFRGSRESLVGRVKDRHVLPFSFREFCLFQFQRTEDKPFGEILSRYTRLRSLLVENRGDEALALLRQLDMDLIRFRSKLDEHILAYWRDGGFPEVWEINDVVRKQEYLWDNFVKKVLFEDLAVAVRYRKPENVARLILYLLANPGVELNTANIAREAGVKRQIVEDNLPLLEMTDLVQRVRKFRSQPLRVREGNFKCYVVDLALRNAVMKSWNAIPGDDRLLGLYAENLVANHLAAWPQAIEVAYYREKDREVDFVVTCGGDARLPVEVKHQRQAEEPRGLLHFMSRYHVPLGLVVTREQRLDLRGRVLYIPLRYFLLAS
jgi:predicted AAA+ superfamily ATPase